MTAVGRGLQSARMQAAIPTNHHPIRPKSPDGLRSGPGGHPGSRCDPPLNSSPGSADHQNEGWPVDAINTFVNINNNRHLEKLKLRESLTADIVSDVEYEVNDLLAWAPDSLTGKDRKAIRDEVIAQTRHITDALTTEELQNEGARRAYTCGAVATVRQMINLTMAQTKRG